MSSSDYSASDSREWINLSSEEWQEKLSREQYQVARQGGTERAFTGAYWNHKEKGMYSCICCGALLFSSKSKFDSGTGWPSFWMVSKLMPLAPIKITLMEWNALKSIALVARHI